MASTRLRNERHKCQLGYPRDGEIRRCDECGRLFIGRTPGNPNYDRWAPLTRLGAWLRGIRRPAP
jgi:hypothetical protein